MRNAPSVSYPVGRCALYGWLLFGLGVSGVGAFAGLHALAYVGQAAQLTVAQTVSGLVICVCWAGVATWRWRQSLQGSLHWDAMATSLARATSPGMWRWQPAGRVRGLDLVRVVTVLDLQSRCLLWIQRPEGEKHWLWVERAQKPDQWDDFRRALVAAH